MVVRVLSSLRISHIPFYLWYIYIRLLLLHYWQCNFWCCCQYSMSLRELQMHIVLIVRELFLRFDLEYCWNVNFLIRHLSTTLSILQPLSPLLKLPTYGALSAEKYKGLMCLQFIYITNEMCYSVPMGTWCVLDALLTYWQMQDWEMRSLHVPTAGLKLAKHLHLGTWP